MTDRANPMLPTPLEIELAGERASALGRAGRKVEAAMARLDALTETDPGRSRAIAETTQVVWDWFVQREACGLRDHSRVVADYRIPRAVLLRLGVG